MTDVAEERRRKYAAALNTNSMVPIRAADTAIALADHELADVYLGVAKVLRGRASGPWLSDAYTELTNVARWAEQCADALSSGESK